MVFLGRCARSEHASSGPLRQRWNDKPDAAVREADALRLAPDLTVGDGLPEMVAGAP
jgi:hypothetical protein